MVRFCIIGSYSGRNAGDCAILENVTREIVERFPGAVCEVPTMNPAFVRNTYPDLPLVPVPCMPWNLSVKLFGLPLALSVLRSDAVIVTAAMLFDVRFWNPLYNFLTSLLIALPLAKLAGKKVFFYGVGVGPINTPKGRAVVRHLLSLGDGVTLREEASVPIMQGIGSTVKPVMAADPALGQRVPEETAARMRERVRKDLGEGPFATVNLNAYVGGWTQDEAGKALTRERFEAETAAAVRRLVDEWGLGAALVCTHHMDDAVMESVLRRIDRPGRAVLYKCRDFDHRELMAVMGMSEFMIGMRLHCQILAVAAGTPCIALNYAPKVRHFMQMAGLEDLVIELDGGYSADLLLGRCAHLRDHRETILPDMLARVAALKQAAKNSPAELARVMEK